MNNNKYLLSLNNSTNLQWRSSEKNTKNRRALFGHPVRVPKNTGCSKNTQCFQFAFANQTKVAFTKQALDLCSVLRYSGFNKKNIRNIFFSKNKLITPKLLFLPKLGTFFIVSNRLVVLSKKY